MSLRVNLRSLRLMTKFVIAPHMRLQEWVAEEKGHFASEGLDYEFRDELYSKEGKKHDLGDKIGKFIKPLRRGAPATSVAPATGP